MIRIIGIQDITIDNYPNINLENIPHWLYGFCNNNSDTKNIGYLITSEAYGHCACIRKYYDNISKKYYDTNNHNFKWPSIDHGMSSKNYTYYGIIVEKCQNDKLRFLSGNESCENIEKIDNYVFSHIISIYLIDHYSDVLNYKKPFTKYLYSVSNMLFPKYFTVNNLNFNPSIIKTNKGIFLDNTIEELSYFFTQNEKVTMDESFEISDKEGNILYDENGNKKMKSTGIISSYYFWMQNRLQYYERNYKKLQDILSNIGGLSRVVIFVAIAINKLVSYYIILLDTEELVLSLDQKEKLKSVSISPTIYRKLNSVINPPKKQYLYYNNIGNNNKYINNNLKKSSKIKRFTQKDIDIYKNSPIKYEKIEKIKYFKNNTFYNKFVNINDKNENGNNIEDIKIKEDKKNNFYKKRYTTRGKISKLSESNHLNLLYNEKLESEENFNIPTKKQNFSWFKYIGYIISCQKNNPIISYYEEFRANILSEESIIKNHLELNKLFIFLKKKNIYEGII